MERDGVEGQYVSYCRLDWPNPMFIKWPTFFGKLKLALGLLLGGNYFVINLDPEQDRQMKQAFDGKFISMSMEILEVPSARG